MVPIDGATGALTIKVLDCEPVNTGLSDATLNRKLPPPGVLPGITPLIVPEAVLITEPMVIGEAKLPAASLSCNVNTLPAENTPDVAYEILTFSPAQISVKLIDGISMVKEAVIKFIL